MTQMLSPNTQAILLLTAPLMVGRTAPNPDLLSPREYKRLARRLWDLKCQPSDLLSSGAFELLQACQSVVEPSRLQRLLGRGFLLSQVFERWRSRAIWVISRADAEYPKLLKSRLKDESPPLLYGCGNINLIESGGFAVVGSRDVDSSLIDYTVAIGDLAARSGRTIISGGAKGIDQAAMRGALEAGGKVVGVLAENLDKVVMDREQRNKILGEQLVLITAYDPGAGFNVGHAMQRNKLIYALANASLVVNSDVNKGGTWAGAVEQLDKYRFAPMFVRATGDASIGLQALRDKGAMPWPEPHSIEEFESVFNISATVSPAPAPAPSQSDLELFSDDESEDITLKLGAEHLPFDRSNKSPVKTGSVKLELEVNEGSPADVLFKVVRKLIWGLVDFPMLDAEVATALNVSNAQAKLWLKRLVDEGVLEKQKKTSRYFVRKSTVHE